MLTAYIVAIDLGLGLKTAELGNEFDGAVGVTG